MLKKAVYVTYDQTRFLYRKCSGRYTYQPIEKTIFNYFSVLSVKNSDLGINKFDFLRIGNFETVKILPFAWTNVCSL